MDTVDERASDDERGSPALPGLPEPRLARCWTMLVGSGGTVPVATIAAAVGYSRQHLTRRFREEFGLSPKRAARIIRFSRAHRMLRSPRSSRTLAEVAASCGYYDEAHLHRDAVEFAGCPPGELAHEPPWSVDRHGVGTD